MATSPPSPAPVPEHESIFGRTRLLLLTIFVACCAVCLALAWVTRDAMLHRASVNRGANRSGQGLVDETPWQTAQTLAALAVTAEENNYARQAERLADHEVDQAFAAALREANLQAQHRKLTGEALSLSQRVAQLQQTVAEDQAIVQHLTAAGNPGKKAAENTPDGTQTDLELAKAQLGLDSDELADATRDLERVTGDQRSEIQSELTARESAMKKYDSQIGQDGEVTVVSVGRYNTLAGRIAAWQRQRARAAQIRQAQQQALSAAASLTSRHNALEQVANAQAPKSAAAGEDRAAQLQGIHKRSLERQLLSIYDDRIQTEQQLAAVYANWAAQVELQHRIVLHLILQSFGWLFLILIAIILADALVRRLIEHPALDRRRRHTLRAILELAIHVVGILGMLFLIFGAPRQTPTIIGLTTAALTIALQDFILAFFGWFVLMGKRGMRVGDSVEIEGVGGEVTEIGLLFTTLIETGPLTEGGYPTGRRISFMNGYAIRGKYFNFSTSGQWMTDQFEVPLSATAHTPLIAEWIQKAIQHETEADARKAELEWKRTLPADAAARVSAAAEVNLRPAGTGFALIIRYVTHAGQRAESRNRLYRLVIELLNAAPAEDTHPA